MGDSLDLGAQFLEHFGLGEPACGAIGLYVPLAAFGVWVTSMSIVVHHALQRQIADGTAPGH